MPPSLTPRRQPEQHHARVAQREDAGRANQVHRGAGIRRRRPVSSSGSDSKLVVRSVKRDLQQPASLESDPKLLRFA